LGLVVPHSLFVLSPLLSRLARNHAYFLLGWVQWVCQASRATD